MSFYERKWSSQWRRSDDSNRRNLQQSGPRPPEETLLARNLNIERKSFSVALKQNPKGRFLRITEAVGAKRNTIIIPATGLPDFHKLIKELSAIAEKSPPLPEQTEDPGAL